MKYRAEEDCTGQAGQACRCQVEYLLDRGVALGVRRPVKVLLGSELPPPSSVSSSVSVGMNSRDITLISTMPGIHQSYPSRARSSISKPVRVSRLTGAELLQNHRRRTLLWRCRLNTAGCSAGVQ